MTTKRKNSQLIIGRKFKKNDTLYDFDLKNMKGTQNFEDLNKLEEKSRKVAFINQFDLKEYKMTDPLPIDFLFLKNKNIKSIAMGKNHFLLVSESNRVFSWGDNNGGNLK